MSGSFPSGSTFNARARAEERKDNGVIREATTETVDSEIHEGENMNQMTFMQS